MTDAHCKAIKRTRYERNNKNRVASLHRSDDTAFCYWDYIDEDEVSKKTQQFLKPSKNGEYINVNL